MEWLLALAMFVGVLALLPPLLRQARSGQRKADAGGVVLAIGLAFVAIFDPGKSAAIEETRRQHELEEKENGDLPNSPTRIAANPPP